MPVQHSPPARKERSQATAQDVLTPTPRAPLDGTQAIPQPRAHLDRGSNLEGAAPSRKEGRGPRRSNSSSGVVGGFPKILYTTLKGLVKMMKRRRRIMWKGKSLNGTEGFPAPVGSSQGTGGVKVLELRIDYIRTICQRYNYKK
ncbi:hypothetical protein O181_019152 [Austropuccinia psidii MF-1]|uniref:Uncharacterized protein n=1 Tax=Austropuccinia psidii MF-1 TaxID=1389203 RepID=A0A9Q3C962_9BASI|nr:hypothetical protein [Austropuccinia psidii MF-1]